MNIIYISKYARAHPESQPTRHYFFSRHWADQGHQVKLIKSRSSLVREMEPFDGLYKEDHAGNLNIVTLNGPLVSRGFNIKRLWSWITFEIKLNKYIRKEINESPDLIVVSSLSILTFLSGIRLKKKYGVPLVLEVRDIYPLTLIEVGGYKKYNPVVLLLGWIEKLGYKKADCIVSSLEHLSEHISQVVSTQVNFEWIPTGFESSHYEKPGQTLLIDQISALKKEGFFIVGYAGTIGLANALDVVFEVAERMHETNPRILFIFFGEGPLKSFYHSKYQHVNNIIFGGFVKKAHLPFYLEKCDILVNTWKKSSLYRYGISPNKWNEYMYSARPFILAFDYSSRIFDEAGCGWQVPSENAGALEEVIQKAFGMATEELDRLGLSGKMYLMNELNYESLSLRYLESVNSKNK